MPPYPHQHSRRQRWGQNPPLVKFPVNTKLLAPFVDIWNPS